MITRFLIGATSIVGGLFLYYLLCLNHVSINEVGLAYDSRDGTVIVQHPGWHRTHPLVRATYINTQPFQVDLNMGMQREVRVLNVKLVRFVPEHAKEFVAIEGFRYYQNGNPYMFAPYAFSGKTYPFLEVLDGGKP